MTKWTSKQDKELYRLMCYIKSSKHLRMIGWIGDELGAIAPHLYADTDFAGCVETQRSTSGAHLVLKGPTTCFPMAGYSQRQDCVSHSTPEAESVALDSALRKLGIPGLLIWDQLLPNNAALQCHEDNQPI